jgi:hypothetical protein
VEQVGDLAVPAPDDVPPDLLDARVVVQVGVLVDEERAPRLVLGDEDLVASGGPDVLEAVLALPDVWNIAQQVAVPEGERGEGGRDPGPPAG